MNAELLEPVHESINLAILPRADGAAVWAEYQSRAEALRKTAETLTVTSIDDTAGQKLARATRLSVREIRLTVERRRVEMVEAMTMETRRINSNAKEVKDFCSAMEDRLLEQEEFIERETERLRRKRICARAAELAPYLTGPVSVDLGGMAAEAYAAFLADAKDLHTLRIEREQAAKAARLAKEKEEAEERERMRQENARLKEEAAARDAVARQERQAAADALQQERQARERVERQASEAAAAEQRRKQAAADDEARLKKRQVAAERKAAAAPDKQKLLGFAAEVRALTVPAVKSNEGVAAAADISRKVAAFADWIVQQAEQL
jgi:hypothetical protein